MSKSGTGGAQGLCSPSKAPLDMLAAIFQDYVGSFQQESSLRKLSVRRILK